MWSITGLCLLCTFFPWWILKEEEVEKYLWLLICDIKRIDNSLQNPPYDQSGSSYIYCIYGRPGVSNLGGEGGYLKPHSVENNKA